MIGCGDYFFFFPSDSSHAFALFAALSIVSVAFFAASVVGTGVGLAAGAATGGSFGAVAACGVDGGCDAIA
jgi:hypothetical protein